MKAKVNRRAGRLARYLAVSPLFSVDEPDPGIAAARSLAIWVPIATLVCGVVGCLTR
jgi:hypothetical protein